MLNYTKSLGEAIKKARQEQGLTQAQLAVKANIDVRTVINIEKFRGNPKMEVLYPLVKALKIDAREIFNPEMQRETPAIQRLRFLIEDCNEEEAIALASIIQSVLNVIRQKQAKNKQNPKKKKKSLNPKSTGFRLITSYHFELYHIN